MSIRWDKAVSCCKNCKTHRFPRASRGFCIRCYRLIQKIEKLEIGKFRRNGRYPEITVSLKRYLIKKTQKQLRENEMLEQGVNEDANAFQLDHLLQAIVRRCPTKPRWIKSGFSVFDRRLNQTAKNWLYLILLDIVENFQCRGLKSCDPRSFE